jgi:hypothetical protein
MLPLFLFPLTSFTLANVSAGCVVGFEYWANPSNPPEGYISWMVDDKRTHRISGAVGPNQGADGSGVGQRLIPEEAISIVLNLGIPRELIVGFFPSLVHRCSPLSPLSSRKLADNPLVNNDFPSKAFGTLCAGVPAEGIHK